jgi:hypothetical protein
LCSKHNAHDLVTEMYFILSYAKKALHAITIRHRSYKYNYIVSLSLHDADVTIIIMLANNCSLYGSLATFQCRTVSVYMHV